MAVIPSKGQACCGLSQLTLISKVPILAVSSTCPSLCSFTGALRTSIPPWGCSVWYFLGLEPSWQHCLWPVKHHPVGFTTSLENSSVPQPASLSFVESRVPHQSFSLLCAPMVLYTPPSKHLAHFLFLAASTMRVETMSSVFSVSSHHPPRARGITDAQNILEKWTNKRINEEMSIETRLLH